jgi:hypothetical protein
MSPAIKYTLGRLGLFVLVFAALLPLPMHIFVKAMIALVASAGFSFFVLRKWRDEMAEQLGSVAQRRSAEKARLRSALAGDDEAAAAGDRVTATETKTAESKTAESKTAESKTAETKTAETSAAETRVAEIETGETKIEAATVDRKAGTDGVAK